MNYQKEIIKIVKTITQEPVLRFVYCLLRKVAVEPEGARIAENISLLFGSE